MNISTRSEMNVNACFSANAFKKFLSRITMMFSLFFLLNAQGWGQSPTRFSSGMFANPNSWSQGSSVAMGTVAGTNILTTTANASGNSYFRFFSATSGGTTYEPNGASDILLTSGTSRALEVAGSGKAFYLNVGSASNNIVFKTSGSGAPGTSSVVCFEIQGTVRSISSLTQPSSTIVPGGTATVSVTLDGALATGQAVWLRYSTAANFSSSTCAKMTGSGTSYSTTIPTGTNTAGTTVYYYAFTSGDVASITGANADLFTINLINNSGSNYQYTVANQFYSKSAGSANLQTASNWGTATDGSGTAPVDFAQNGVTYHIRNSATATIGSSWTVSGTGSKIVVGDGTNACNFTVSGSLTVTSPATDISNAATVTRTTLGANSWGTLNVQGGGTYDHAVNGGTVPTATWAATSVCKISGTTDTYPTGGMSQTFGIATWDCSSQSQALTISGNFFTTSPTVNIVSTGSQYLATTSTTSVTGTYNISGGRFIANLAASNLSLTIGGSLNVSGTGVFEVSNWGAGTLVHEVFVTSNVVINGGTVDLNKQSSSNNAGRLYIAGNLTVSGTGVLTRTQTGTTGSTGVYFNGSSGSTQSFSWQGGTISTASGGVGRRFYYKNVSGPTTLNESYTGSAAQTTINGTEGSPATNYAAWPTASVIGSFTVTNTLGVTLSTNKLIRGTVTLSSGSLDLGGNTLTLNSGSSAQSVAGGGSNAFNITNGTITLTGSDAHTITLSNFGTTSSGGLTLGTDVTLQMNSNAALNCGGNGSTTSMLTVLGTMIMNSGTASNIDGGRPPFYGSASTLEYRASYNVFDEWRAGTAITTPGVPQNVNINAASITVTTPGSSSPRTAAGNLTITNGTFTLGSQLSVGGNWNRAGGTFTNGSQTVVFNGANDATITDASGASFSGLTIDKSSASNTVTLNNAVSVAGTLTLTRGLFVTTSTNLLHVTATGSGTISGGSINAYVSGPLRRTLPASQSGTPGTWVMPVGKHTGTNPGYYPLSLVNPQTGSGTVTVTATAFNETSGGSAGTGLSAISTSEYWSLASSGNYTSSSYSVARPSAVSPSNAIGHRADASAAGAYATIGGTASGSAITGSSSVNGAAQHYFVLGVLAIPTVSTNSITSITNTTATGGGNTLSDGGSSITAKGVCWNTATGPTTSNSTTSDGTGTANYSSSITGLSPQTLYYVRAYATNANATSYGSEVTFRTLSTEPTSATTNFAAASQSTSQINLSWSAASLPASGYTNSGYIIIRRIDGSNPTTTGVTDGVDPASLSLASGTTLVTTVSSVATTSFNHTSLTASLAYNYMIIPFTWDGTNATTYNYRTSDPQTANANTYVFVTQVTTGRPLTGTWYVGDYAGGGNGSGTTNFQFQVDQGSWNKSEVGIGQNTDGTTGWNWNDAFFYIDNGASKRVQRNIGGVQFTSAGTWYVVGRARTNSTDPWSYADVSGSTNDVNLTLSTSSGNTPYYTVTALGDPTITSATAVSPTQIDLVWSQFASRDVLIVRYAAAAAVTAPTSGQSYSAGNTIGAGTVVYKGNATSVSSTDLAPGTGYKYIFYSENYLYYSSGTNSGTVTTIAASAPSISSPSKSSITHNSATLGGNITSNGGTSITARGTVFKTTSPVTISDNLLAEGGTSTGSFTHSRTSLSPQTLYYYRAYATNSTGSGLTSEDNFRTLSSPVTAQPSSFVASSASTQLDVSWDAATFPVSGATQGGYLVIYATGTPSLSSSNGTAPAAGVGTLINITPTNLPTAPATSTTITGLTNGTTYNLLLVPYTWDGSNAATYNYLISGALTAIGIPSNAATITSNGTGGGAWTSGSSWMGGVAPGSGDNVVIATSDVISVSSSITRNPGTTTTVNGTFRINNSGFASGGTWVYGASSTLQFATTGNYNVQSDHIYWPSSNSPANVIVGSGGITLGSNAQANRTVTGNFTTSGPVTLSNSSVLTINGICQRNAGGSFANSPMYGPNGTLRYNTNTITGRGPEWASNTGAGRPHNVIIAGNTTLDYPNGNNDYDLAIGGDLTIESGNLYMDFGDGAAAGQISVGGDVSIAGNVSLGDGSGGDLYVGGDWTHTSGTLNNNGRSVYFNGSGTQTINNAETFANLRVDKSAGGSLVLTGNTTVTSTLTLTVANTATLVVNPGVVLTFATGQFNGDPVVLKSSAAGTAAIGNITSLSGASNVTVERYIPAQRKWRMLTAPLTGNSNNSIYANWQNGGTADGSTGAIFWSNTGGTGLFTGGSGTSILSFDPTLSTQGGWAAVSSTQATGSLFDASANKSYIAFITGPYNEGGSYISGSPAATTLKATGSLRSGAVSFSGLTSGKYHIVGNPYASAVNFNTIGRTNAGAFVYVWDPAIGSLGGYTPIDNLSGEILESGQAFLVLAQGGNATVSFAETDKSTNTSNTMFRRQNTDPRFTVTLNKFLNGVPKMFDRAWVDFQTDANAGVDGEDAIKPSNFTENLSIIRNTQDLMVERRPQLTTNDTIYLRMWRTAATQYQFEFVPERMNLSAGTTAVLQDLFLGTETNLSMSNSQRINFMVTQDAASSGNRFRIVFRANTVTPVTNLNGEKAFAVYPNPVAKGGVMQVEFRNRTAGMYNVRIFNLAGAQVQQESVRHAGGTAVQQIRLNTQLTPGAYIAEINGQNGTTEKVKLIIQ